MPAAKYVPDPAFLEGMRMDTANNAALMEFAYVALAATIDAAPGRMKRFYLLDQDRYGAPQLISTSSFWHLIEYGSVNNEPYAPFRRGVEACGATFVDEGPGA